MKRLVPEVIATNEALSEYRNNPLFVPVHQYGDARQVERGEVGALVKRGRVLRRIFTPNAAS